VAATRPRMVIHIALEDGFDGDTVAIRVDGVEAYRGEGVTTRTQISHAASAELEVPDGTARLEIDVPTRGAREIVDLDPSTANVAVSLRDGRIEVAFREQLGFA
jgi:hypothetical protein